MGADLSGDNLKEANFVRAELWGANMTETQAQGANFTNANFTGATLDGTDLATSILVGVHSGGVLGRPNLPGGWKLKAGYLLGPRANLAEANLSNLVLRGVSLQGATMNGVNLHKAKFIGANLRGAVLTGAKLSGVFYDGATVCPNGKKFSQGGNCPS